MVAFRFRMAQHAFGIAETAVSHQRRRPPTEFQLPTRRKRNRRFRIAGRTMSGEFAGTHDHSSSGSASVGVGAEQSASCEMGYEVDDGVGDELRCLDQRAVALAIQNGDAGVREHVRQRVDGLARMQRGAAPTNSWTGTTIGACRLMSGSIEYSELDSRVMVQISGGAG